MTNRFRLTLAQLNSTLGDLHGNASRAREAWQAGREVGADLVALPELFLTGGGAQDLIAKPAFVAAAVAEVEALARHCADGPALAIGAPWPEAGTLHNGYCLLQGGRVAAVTPKFFLPNSGALDEVRTFSRGAMQGPVNVGGVRIGMPLGEDACHPDVVEAMEETGAEILLVPAAWPYFRNGFDLRQNQVVARVVESGLPLACLNMVGGEGALVFDGGSFVLNARGVPAVQLPVMAEAVEHVDFLRGPEGWIAQEGRFVAHPGGSEQDYAALVLGLRDYCAKTGVDRVLVGLGSAGAALVAAVAVDALGRPRVRGVAAEDDRSARACAAALGLGCDALPLAQAQTALATVVADIAPARLRALLLETEAERGGEMLLATATKSGLALGCGPDAMVGGYALLKDLFQTGAVQLSQWRNANHRAWMLGPPGMVIPQEVIATGPDPLDAILEILVVRDGSVADCVAAGHDRADVIRAQTLLTSSEKTRADIAPGPRLSDRAFGLDRRYPAAHRWREE